MEKTVSDGVAAALAQAGVHRVYGLAGDGLNPLALSLQREKRLRWVHVRHEETAAFAASAEAQLTGRVAVCCGSCGSGQLHLLNGLYDAHRSAAAVLAVVSHPATLHLGSSYMQETHPARLFRDCTAYRETVCGAEQAPAVLAAALRTARAQQDAGLVALPGDVALMPQTETVLPPCAVPERGALCPDGETLHRMAAMLNESPRVTFLCGIGCAAAKEDVVALARRLQAPVAYTLRAKDIMEGDNPCEVGMTGIMGWGGAPVAVADCDVLVLWGTDFPYAEFLPARARVVQVDVDCRALGRRVPLALAVHGDVREVARALLPLIRRERGDEHLAAARCLHRRVVAEMEGPVRAPDEGALLRPEYVTRLLSDLAEPDAVFTVGTGAPVLWAARYLRTADARRLLGSFKHGAMACALAMAIGAKAAYPSRQVIALCSSEGLSMLPGDILTLMQEHLSVKIFVYNASVPESETMAGNGSNLPPVDFAAMARGMGIAAGRICTVAEAGPAVKRWLAEPGPALLDAVTDCHARGLPPSLSLGREAVCERGFSLSQGLEGIQRLLFGRRRVEQ